MTNAEIASELQGINGFLIGIEDYIRKYNESFYTIRLLQDARSRIVALARQLEPPVEPKPEAVRTIGSCPVHDYVCPLCGFGAGCAPACGCPEMRR